MPSERTDRRAAYVDKATVELRGLVEEGVVMSGNAFSQVLLAKGQPDAGELPERLLAGADGEALRAALAALGYAPEDWVGLATCDADGTALDSQTLRLAVTALDPATVIALDDAAAGALREAYGPELVALPDLQAAMLAPGVVAQVAGMRMMGLGGFEAALADKPAKQLMWARLKQVRPLGEPF
ncbi:MAG: hypothetical protein PHR15_07160 [Atopobiaceae bacterium]|nr:hypothetical protein [Atopobiaceae bacterium]MCH4181478.1 hypothetical protein [Atopobiaceae bacterium]MCH4214840.1 hypothetical protein [Atopobiaceae bacterium]MCH4230086.1 hypothetical protein [Atopobiaceae bacterium]MCH4276962.1 hypothetical protein [Atopobiaceae bacterium]